MSCVSNQQHLDGQQVDENHPLVLLTGTMAVVEGVRQKLLRYGDTFLKEHFYIISVDGFIHPLSAGAFHQQYTSDLDPQTHPLKMWTNLRTCSPDLSCESVEMRAYEKHLRINVKSR